METTRWQHKVQSLTIQIEKLQKELEQGELRASENTEKLKELVSWADIFDSCNPEEKKMIVSNMLNRVIVGRLEKDEDYSTTIV